MRSLKTHALFKEKNKFLMESIFLVMLDQIFQMIRENNNFHCAQVSSSEFLSSHANEANLFPHLRNISFLCCIECSLILLQLDENLSKFLIVSNMRVKNLSSLVKFLIEAPISTLLNISLVRLRDKLLEFGKVSLATLGICEDQL